MAQNRDTVLLMTSKTAQIEEIQQRYIDALENRISLLESQTRNVQQVIKKDGLKLKLAD